MHVQQAYSQTLIRGVCFCAMWTSLAWREWVWEHSPKAQRYI